MRNYLSLFLLELHIDGADFNVYYLLLLKVLDDTDKVTNLQNKNTISKKFAFFCFKESIILKKLHIDGTDFYANYIGCLVSLNDGE